MSQSTYALKINKVTVRARTQPEDKATPAEIRSLRECNGAIQWLAKESRPVCVMVVFPSLGNELQMRSFWESLDSEHSSSATSVKVKVPAMLIDAISFEESAATLTLKR